MQASKMQERKEVIQEANAQHARMFARILKCVQLRKQETKQGKAQKEANIGQDQIARRCRSTAKTLEYLQLSKQESKLQKGNQSKKERKQQK